MPNYESKKLYIFKDNKMVLLEKNLEEALIDFSPLLEAMTDRICTMTNCINDREDILQTASLEFIKIYNSYDYTKNVSFNHFAKTILYKKMYSRVINRRKKSINTTHLHTCYEIDKASNNYSYIDTLMDLKQYVNSISLKEKERLIIQYRLRGMNQSEISEKLGVNQSTVSRILGRFKDTFMKSKIYYKFNCL